MNTEKTKPTVMVVDDEEEICEILSIFLEDDFEVTSFTDPTKAREELAKTIFDLILTDLKMPVVDGFQIIEAAQTHQEKTPLIVVSGHAREEVEIKEVLENGAVDVITKPFSSQEDFIDILKKHVNF